MWPVVCSGSRGVPRGATCRVPRGAPPPPPPPTRGAITRARGRGVGVLATVRPLGLGLGPSRGELGPAGPLGSVDGGPDRHAQGAGLICPLSVPAAGGRGLRPRVFSAHGPPPQLHVHAPACSDAAWAVTSRPLAVRLQTGGGGDLLHTVIPTNTLSSSTVHGLRSLHRGCALTRAVEAAQ
jgi:hypothetical protein